MRLWRTEPFVGIKRMQPAAWEALTAIAWHGVAGEGLSGLSLFSGLFLYVCSQLL